MGALYLLYLSISRYAPFLSPSHPALYLYLFLSPSLSLSLSLSLFLALSLSLPLSLSTLSPSSYMYTYCLLDDISVYLSESLNSLKNGVASGAISNWYNSSGICS